MRIARLFAILALSLAPSIASAQFVIPNQIYVPQPGITVPGLGGIGLPSIYVDTPRIRFGISGGVDLGGGQAGTFDGGATVHVGLQVNDLFAVYYRGRGQIGFVWGGSSLGLYGAVFNAVLFDLTFADMFQIGLGPSFDYMAYSTCNTAICIDAGTIGFGGDARIALTIPYFTPRQALLSIGQNRAGVTFELNIHTGAYGFDHTVFGYGQVGVAVGWILY